jgi:hypothetical protein
LLFTTDIAEKIPGELNKYHWAIIISVLYVAQNLFEYLRDYNYIYFNDEGNRILFRYIPLSPFKNRRYSIEIGKHEFHGYKIQKPSLFKKMIVFYIKTPQGVAKYPPISISALNGDEFNQLKKALNQNLQ